MVDLAHVPFTQDRRLPLYQRLRDDLSAKIAGRAWGPGDMLPSEQALAEHYQVAPGTVRRAIETMVQEGQLERRQGKGTFVRRPDFSHSLFRFFRYTGEAGGRKVPESHILDRKLVMPGQAIAEQLRLAPGEQAIRFERMRLIDGTPLLLEQIWLPHSRFAGLLVLPVEDYGELLYPLYERCCGQVVARARERLTAESADPALAEKLSIEPDTTVIVIERLAMGYDDAPLEWRRSRGPAESFEYEAEIR